MIAVVKVGGAAPGAAAQVAALARAGRQVVVVHGAGPQITAGCIAAGLEPRFVDGQRVTDDAVMRVVERPPSPRLTRRCAPSWASRASPAGRCGTR